MTSQGKKVLTWSIIVAVLIGSWLVYRFVVQKDIRIISPSSDTVWQASQTYKIVWNPQNISKVGIVLVKGVQPQEVKWLAQNLTARHSTYDWQIFTWEKPGDDYRIAIFEYPWEEGNKIVYSEFFTILGPQFASCDNLSIASEWPFIPSDFPDTRKVFITSKTYNGNLERLAGADKICQTEAHENGFGGDWKALLGDDTEFAVSRLNLQGAFVMAQAAASLPEGKSCHRLLGKDFNEFLAKLSVPLAQNSEKIEKTFLKDLQSVWLGRVFPESKRECAVISAFAGSNRQALGNLALNYSFTTTCQNWTAGTEVVPGYPQQPGQTTEFAACFTPAGVRTDAVGLAGLSSGLVKVGQEDVLTVSLGKSCALAQKLICVQQ